jgi:hypothetical protein
MWPEFNRDFFLHGIVSGFYPENKLMSVLKGAAPGVCRPRQEEVGEVFPQFKKAGHQ